MAASPMSRFDGAEARMPSFWLPPRSRGNGLTADRWIDIVVVPTDRCEELMRALRVAGVPARAVAVRPAVRGKGEVRILVDPDGYAHAENVLLRKLADDETPPTRREVRQLWWFCAGAIMDAGTAAICGRRGVCARDTAGCISAPRTN